MKAVIAWGVWAALSAIWLYLMKRDCSGEVAFGEADDGDR